MNLDTVGENIRKYHLVKKFCQEDVDERAGLSVNHTGMVERGEKIPLLETHKSIVNVLEVSVYMVFADVLNTGYKVKNLLLNDRLSKLSEDEKRKYMK